MLNKYQIIYNNNMNNIYKIVPNIKVLVANNYNSDRINKPLEVYRSRKIRVLAYNGTLSLYHNENGYNTPICEDEITIKCIRNAHQIDDTFNLEELLNALRLKKRYNLR